MIVILDNLRSALNVGAIIRTADGLGIKEVWLCGITPGPENEKVKKTALGAENSVTLREFKRTQEAVLELKKKQIPIFSLELTSDAVEVKDAHTNEEIGLVVGNEVSGVSDEVLRLSDQIVKIEMKGKKESLNVATAFAIAAYVLKNPL